LETHSAHLYINGWTPNNKWSFPCGHYSEAGLHPDVLIFPESSDKELHSDIIKIQITQFTLPELAKIEIKKKAATKAQASIKTFRQDIRAKKQAGMKQACPI